MSADKAAAQLKMLGFSVYNSSGNMHSMDNTMMDMKASMEGMSAEDR